MNPAFRANRLPTWTTLLSEDLFMIHKIQANDFSQPMPNENITPILDI